MRGESPKSSISDLKRNVPASEPPTDVGRIPRPSFKWTTRVLVPAAVIEGLVGLFLLTAYRELAPAPRVRVAPVVVKRVSGAVQGTVTVQAAGWVEADPYTSYVSALTDGIVCDILVLEGERVEQNQVVARLVDDNARLALQRARAEVQELEAALESARAALDAAKTDWENPVERIHAVQAAEAELRESRATLNQVIADLAVEEALLVKVKTDHDRAVPLRASGAISDSEFVRYRSQSDAQTAKVRALTERRAATEARIAKHEADLVRARDQMRLRTDDRHKLDRSQAAYTQAQAALARAKIVRDEAQLRLDRMEVRCPTAGVVMKRLASPGSKLLITSDDKHSAQVLTLYDPNRLQVRVDVPLADAGKIGVGQAAQIVVEVLPDKIFAGTVTRVLHEANIQKNTLEVKVAISNPEPQLRPAMLARVKFLAQVEIGGEEVRETLFGPTQAFHKAGGSITTWVVRNRRGDSGTAYAQSVEVGRQVDGWVEVTKGLQPGDLVVIDNASELTNGKRVLVSDES